MRETLYMRRIETRPYRVGSGGATEPEAFEDLEVRREKHERLTRGKPAKSFKQILKERMYGEDEEQDPSPPEPSSGAIEPYLGLDPRQDAQLANQKGRRSAKVIIKG